MTSTEPQPGPLAAEKTSDDSPPEEKQPVGTEVESARLLANQAREALSADGFETDDIRNLADRFVAEDRGGDIDEFVLWARETRAPQS